MEQKILSYITIILVIVALVFSFFAFKQDNQIVKEENTLSQIIKKGVINVCYGIYPPAVIRDAKTNELSGHDIDTIKSIAEVIKVKPEFSEQAWGNMVSALQSKRCDVALTLFAQIPRAASVAFSRPLYFVGDGVLALKGESRFSNISDIDKPGIKVVVANGESGHNYVNEHFKNAKIIVIDVEGSDYSRIFTEVTSGRVDVAIADASTVQRYALTHPETVDLFKDKQFNLNPVSFAVRQNDTAFLQFLNTSIDYLELNGRIKELEQKYGANWLHEVKSYQIQ